MIWVPILLTIYGLSLLYVLAYSLTQLRLAWWYGRRTAENTALEQPTDWPAVTVQLPIYNEATVVERLLHQVARLDYPKDKLHIQVLDDSTDETQALVDQVASDLQQGGHWVEVVRREKRTGFKAGALALGTAKSPTDIFAIFDADFLPPTDFLKNLVPYLLADDRLAAVQARWSHLNEGENLFTRLQAIGLNTHFTVEQTGRSKAGSFINFNGTCGLWRRQAIADAGGWQHDTLTEDLDLSYRAQLTGWRLKYVEQHQAPGELPVHMPAIKSQQYRWNKGAAECARKLLGAVWGSELSLRSKWHALFHLGNSTSYLFLLTAALSSLPLAFIDMTAWSPVFMAFGITLAGLLAVLIALWQALGSSHTPTARKSLGPQLFPFLVYNIGLAWHNGVAVLSGWLGRRSSFVRTPKMGTGTNRRRYMRLSAKHLGLTEAVLMLAFLGASIYQVVHQQYFLLSFHLLLALGFGLIFGGSLRSWWVLNRWRRE